MSAPAPTEPPRLADCACFTWAYCDEEPMDGHHPTCPVPSLGSRLRLYHVEVDGGAVYWVIGNEGAPAEMQAAIERVEGVAFAEEDWPALTPDDIREVPEPEARTMTCIGDGEPDVDMWTAAVRQRRCPESVVACSEWP